MELIRYFRRQSPGLIWALLAVSLLAGGAGAFLMGLVDHVAQGSKPGQPDAALIGLFLGAIALNVCLHGVLQTRLTRLSMRLLTRLRLELLDSLRQTPLAAYEKLGREEIYTVLTRDTGTIANAAPFFVYASSALVTLLCCFGYLAVLSPAGFGVALVTAALGVGFYLFRDGPISRKLQQARNSETRFFHALEQMLNGFKELKMSQARNDELFRNYISRASEEARDLGSSALSAYIWNGLIADMFYYLLLGLVIFAFGWLNPAAIPAIPGIALLVVYMRGPLEGLVNVVPAFTNASISLNRLQSLSEAIRELPHEKPVVHIPRSFTEIQFRQITYTYRDAEGNAGFSLGPVEGYLRQGEIVFLVGGNGSGKTTLTRLLTGLYSPETGDITLDGNPLTSDRLPEYRHLITPIFSDYFLFDRFYGLPDVDPVQVRAWLEWMEIGHKVRFEQGAFSTLNLSAGQRKRLALVYALAEQRPLVVLDEWAADQDPHFRRKFYTEILPALREQGKTILAVTHDDAWFHLADRVLKMDQGQLVSLEGA